MKWKVYQRYGWWIAARGVEKTAHVSWEGAMVYVEQQLGYSLLAQQWSRGINYRR